MSISEDSAHDFFDRDCQLEFGFHWWTTMLPMRGLLFCVWCGMWHPCFIPSDNIVEELVTFLCILLKECQCCSLMFGFVFICQLLWHPSYTHFLKTNPLGDNLVQQWAKHLGELPDSSKIVKCQFCKTACHTLSISSDITGIVGRYGLRHAHWFGLQWIARTIVWSYCPS